MPGSPTGEAPSGEAVGVQASCAALLTEFSNPVDTLLDSMISGLTGTPGARCRPLQKEAVLAGVNWRR